MSATLMSAVDDLPPPVDLAFGPSVAPALADPAPARRRRGMARRVGHLAVACAMGSWILLPLMPVIAAILWVEGLT